MRRAALLFLALGVAVSGCSTTDLATRPSGSAGARLQLAPRFQGTPPSGLTGVATQLSIALRRADQSMVADTTVQMAPGQQTVTIAFTLPTVTTTEPLSVRINFADDAGVLLYRGEVPDIRADGRNVPVPIDYSGPATLSVAEDSLTLPTVGATASISAELRDPNGVPVPGVRTTWQSSAPTVASVDSTGVVTGINPGTASITAMAYGLSGPPVTVTVPNRYAWRGESGNFFDSAMWLGGRAPLQGADIDLTADGDYTVELIGDWWAAESSWRIGKPGNTGRQTLVVNEGNVALGAVLSAKSVHIAQSALVDATDWLLDVVEFVNEGHMLVREAVIFGGPYDGRASSTLELADSAPLLLFRDHWESGTLAPQVPAGGPVINEGLLTGDGFIFFIGRPDGMENYGTIAPRPRLLVDGELLLGAGSVLSIRANGLQPQSEHDLLHGLKDIVIDGGTFELMPTFLPPPQGRFAPLLARTLAGTFSNISGTRLPDGRTLLPQYRAGGLDLACCAP